jgi:beta-glucosidase
MHSNPWYSFVFTVVLFSYTDTSSASAQSMPAQSAGTQSVSARSMPAQSANPRSASTPSPRPHKYPYQNPALPVAGRVSDLLGRMTVEEKIRQLDMFWGKEVADMTGHEATAYNGAKVSAVIGTHGIGSIHDFYPVSAGIANQIQRYAIEKTRLGIPVLFIEEGLHGYSGKGSTEFPIPLQLASAWDTALVRRVGHVIATETRAHGVDMILGPVLCLARDPRWGRAEETYGEDPYLDAWNGVSMVKGMQGAGLSRPDAVISEPKHFMTHGIPEGGSNTAPVNMGERENRTDFLYPFEKAVRVGGAMGIMAAYSELDGIPCVDNHWMLTDVLRKEWGFKGFVLSDLGAIKLTLTAHHVARDTADAMAQTLHAGLDMQFYDFGHEELIKAVSADITGKTLSMEDLDRAAGDVLRVKFLLGLFDHPYTDTTLADKVFHTGDSQDLALTAAREGIVLLKNDKNTLPLDAGHQSIAVIGPLATSTYVGGYSSPSAAGISILDALKARAGGNARIAYEKGYDPGVEGAYQDALDPAAVQAAQDAGTSGTPIPDSSVQEKLLQKALALVRQSDVAVVVLGEEPKEVGEGRDRASLDLSPQAIRLIRALYATGKPISVVLFNGRPLTINWVAAHIPAILETWFAGEKGGLAVADVLLGKINPSGKLPMTFPRSVGQLPFYYDKKPTSYHRYVDEVATPLFPFGLGLSYTRFSYSNLRISPQRIPVGGTADISVTVTNTGDREGTEVAQLYLRDMVSSVTTAEKALKGFGRITLKPGESGMVHFTLGADQLSLWNREMKQVVEPGEFRIMIGSSSADIRQTGSLWVGKP